MRDGTSFDPDELGALYDKARRLEDAGDVEGAARLYEGCLALDPDDHCGVVMRLAAFGRCAPHTAPPAYVATLFDQNAETFDETLVDRLGYDVPALSRRIADRHAIPQRIVDRQALARSRILDVGCGTGLVGAAFADLGAMMVGVDLAEGMLAIADARDVYADLYVGEAVQFMAEWDEEPFDLVVAADVWPYLGDLTGFTAGAARCLSRGGALIASSETTDDGWSVTATQRFAHSLDHITTALSTAGFHVAAVEEIVVRHEEGRPVPGHLVLAVKRSAGMGAAEG
ncbi:MAG: methyltransferase domain-containing protein [Pseudomonadota bacterium]